MLDAIKSESLTPPTLTGSLACGALPETGVEVEQQSNKTSQLHQRHDHKERIRNTLPTFAATIAASRKGSNSARNSPFPLICTEKIAGKLPSAIPSAGDGMAEKEPGATLSSPSSHSNFQPLSKSRKALQTPSLHNDVAVQSIEEGSDDTDEGNFNGGEAQEKPPRVTRRFTSEHYTLLQSWFDTNDRPNEERMEHLAVELVGD
jgi:hypothetical protein